MLLIKPTAQADYHTIVKALDEMLINEVKKYALVQPEQEELNYMEKNDRIDGRRGIYGPGRAGFLKKPALFLYRVSRKLSIYPILNKAKRQRRRRITQAQRAFQPEPDDCSMSITRNNMVLCVA